MKARTRPKSGAARGKYPRIEVPPAVRSKAGQIAALTRENQPEVIARVCGPALDAELKRLAGGKS